MKGLCHRTLVISLGAVFPLLLGTVTILYAQQGESVQGGQAPTQEQSPHGQVPRLPGQQGQLQQTTHNQQGQTQQTTHGQQGQQGQHQQNTYGQQDQRQPNTHGQQDQHQEARDRGDHGAVPVLHEIGQDVRAVDHLVRDVQGNQPRPRQEVNRQENYPPDRRQEDIRREHYPPDQREEELRREHYLQELHREEMQDRRELPPAQPTAWVPYRANHWQMQRRTWPQRGGYVGYRIPRILFNGYFGASHPFRMNSLPFEYSGGYPRFQYNGLWFSVLDPYPEFWPRDWYQSGDAYINFTDGGYYLYNRNYPGNGLALKVSLN